jgi:hypothetical protein
MRARERIAAERAARKRPEARRRNLVAIASITAVLAFVVALVAVKLTSTPARLVASESQAPSAVARQVTAVPAAVLAKVSPGQAVTPLHKVKTSGPPLTIGTKPAIVFVSEESCPFCAARTMVAGHRALPFRHLEPPRHHEIIGHRHVPGHRHALVPGGPGIQHVGARRGRGQRSDPPLADR